MSRRPQEQPEEAPEALQEALRDLLGRAEPPARVGEALSKAARERAPQVRSGTPVAAAAPAASRPPRRAARRLQTLAFAAAAGVALLLWGPWRAPRRAPAGANVADLDGSGRIDVWDAYLLAKAVESGDALDPLLDFDGDGAVTRADADAVARKAVEHPR